MQPNPHFAPLLLTQTADETKARVDVSTFDHLVLYIVGTGTIASGSLTIGEAHDVSYSGTWSTLTTVTAADVTGGAVKAVHLAVGAYAALEVRIDTAIGGGGNVSVYLEAH